MFCCKAAPFYISQDTILGILDIQKGYIVRTFKNFSTCILVHKFFTYTILPLKKLRKIIYNPQSPHVSFCAGLWHATTRTAMFLLFYSAIVIIQSMPW